MSAPGVARGRRAFLAPVWLSVTSVLASAVLLFLFWRWASTPSLVLLVPLPQASAATEAAAPWSRIASSLDDGERVQAIIAPAALQSQIVTALAAPQAVRMDADDIGDWRLAYRLRWHMRGQLVVVALDPLRSAALLHRLAGDRAPQAPAEVARRIWLVTASGLTPPVVLPLHY